MELAGAVRAHGPVPRHVLARRLFLGLLLLAVAVSLVYLATGAARLEPSRVLAGFFGGALERHEQVVLFEIRLPRLALGMLVGAGLAVSGALMQGLFRNPLADPGIVGVGAGASFGAVAAIVLGGMLPLVLREQIGQWLIPIAAFAGGWIATLLLYQVARRSGQTSVATMLLAGIALAALASAMTGLLIYTADDQQLRDLTFWSMGSLAGASWPKFFATLPLILPVLIFAPLLGRGLNAMALGEAAASHMGIHVERVKTLAIMAVAAAAGASVAAAGGIGFIGIVVPHLVRLIAGPDHRWLLPNAAIFGGVLLVGADMIARQVVSPAELPIGIVTALLGAPVFLWILLKNRNL